MKKWKAIRDNFVKGLRQQRNMTTGQPALKKRRYVYFDQSSFCCLLLAMEKKLFSNIPSPEIDTVDVVGGSATDVSSDLTVHQEEQPNNIQNSQSCSGSGTGGKSTGREKTKENILTATKDISKILSESVALQREERQSDQLGNKSFLTSFLPLMGSLSSDLTNEASYKITEVFRNISATRRASSFAISPASASSTSPLNVTKNVSDTSEGNFIILNFYQLYFPDFDNTNFCITKL
jgi:hypothetical protein